MTPAYELTRVVLGLTCLAVFCRLYRSYFLISGVALLIPQSLYSPIYWREIWLPVETIRLVAAIWLSASLLARVRPLSKQEHRSIIGFGLCAGIGLATAAWLWKPENGFQVATTIRQYAYLILTMLMCGWCARHWVRPTPISPLTGLWCWWLACATVMACGGRSGLLRELPIWREGESWQAVGIAGMAGQALIALRLLTLHIGKPAPKRFKPSLQPD